MITAVLTHICLAQRSSIVDSLNKLLQTQKDDSSKVKTLNALSRQLWQTASFNESENNAHKALALAEIINDNKGKADAYYNIGIVYTYQSKYQQALDAFFEGLRFSETLKYKKGRANAYNGLAGIYYNQGNYSEAIKHLIAYNKVMQELGDKKGVANSYNNIGAIYSAQGNYYDALKNYFASLKIREELREKKEIASSLSNIGSIYTIQGNYYEALKNYSASLKINEQIGNKMGIASLYNQIGLTYLHLNNYTEAYNNCIASLKKFEEISFKSGIASAYTHIGLVYNRQGNYTESLKNHFASLKIQEELGNQKGIACSYVNIGEASLNMKNFSEAKKFLNDGLMLSKKIGAKDDIKNSYANLARLDSAAGNWEEAYKNYKLFIFYRDSLANEDNSKKMLQTQMQYEFDKKEDSLNYIQALTNEKLKRQSLLNLQQQQSLLMNEKVYSLMLSEKKLQQLALEKNQAEFAVQKSEVEKNQNELVILNNEKAIQSLQLKKQKLFQNYLFLVLILFSVLSVFIYKHYDTKQKLKLQTLRNKIASDLHDDVGSTLSSISIFSQMAQQQSKVVVPFLDTINESSQKMLDAMADIVWTINPENDQFEKIVMRMRSFAYELLGAKNIDFEFIADEEVASLKLLMDVRKNLYLIFKEATNNMVKYSGADKALFSITAVKNNLTMLIQVNGKGFNVSHLTAGNGLKNMKKRAEEIGGKLNINSFPGKGTTVKLNVTV